MTVTGDEYRLLRLWRAAAGEMPGVLLDRRILKAAWRALRGRLGN
jgi:hypothetical protein